MLQESGCTWIPHAGAQNRAYTRGSNTSIVAGGRAEGHYTGRMDRLWTPWRLAYVSAARGEQRPGVPEELSGWPGEEDKGCVFCNMIAAVRWAARAGMSREDAEKAALILEEGEGCFVCLNRYPYSTGHVMVVPYRHESSLAKLEVGTAEEMMRTARRVEVALRETYRPDGLNLGMNLGEAAGAGVAEHLHLHELPRWSGDTNFMTSIGDVRVMPQTLGDSYARLREVILRDV